jgi:hypothetical protein
MEFNQFRNQFLEQYGNYKIRKELKDCWKNFFLEKFDTTHFITLNFNRWLKINNELTMIGDEFWNIDNRRNWTIDRKIEYTKEKVETWNSKLQRSVLGNTWYKGKMRNEKIMGVLFLQNITTNLHLHGFISIREGNWKFGLEDKIQKFESVVNVWNRRIVEGGQVWLERIRNEDFDRCISYTTRQETFKENFGNFITL